MKSPLVSFGIVNCNRLFYMRSCLESLIACTDDYPNREFIVVDNASVENGTLEYLEELRSRGITVIRNETRDPANEFAKGINTICKLAKGELIVPLQGDMQFIIKGGWLQHYVDLAMSRDDVGCVCFDAQRRITHRSHKDSISEPLTEDFKFVVDAERPKVSGAADVMYKKSVIDLIFPWSEDNMNHEGSQDSETEMIKRSSEIIGRMGLEMYCFIPVIPVAVAIYTDSRGTNARVRGNRLYGDYWPPKPDSVRYYDIFDFSSVVEAYPNRKIPIPIEEIARPMGWEAPIDAAGDWMKNPIRPETASASDYVELFAIPDNQSKSDYEHIDDWLKC